MRCRTSSCARTPAFDPATASSRCGRGCTASPTTAASTSSAGRPCRLPRCCELVRRPIHDPIAEAEQRESLRRLIADVRRLPEQQRSALLMRELGGMTYTELAAALGVSVPAVKSLLVRARVGLAQAAEARDTACCGDPRRAGPRPRSRRASERDRPGVTCATASRAGSSAARCAGVSRQFAALAAGARTARPAGQVLGFGGAGGGAPQPAAARPAAAAQPARAGTGGGFAAGGVLATAPATSRRCWLRPWSPLAERWRSRARSRRRGGTALTITCRFSCRRRQPEFAPAPDSGPERHRRPGSAPASVAPLPPSPATRCRPRQSASCHQITPSRAPWQPDHPAARRVPLPATSGDHAGRCRHRSRRDALGHCGEPASRLPASSPTDGEPGGGHDPRRRRDSVSHRPVTPSNTEQRQIASGPTGQPPSRVRSGAQQPAHRRAVRHGLHLIGSTRSSGNGAVTGPAGTQPLSELGAQDDRAVPREARPRGSAHAARTTVRLVHDRGGALDAFAALRSAAAGCGSTRTRAPRSATRCASRGR